MTVETTLQEMFDNYPTLFTTRKECYNHLFCTIGTGYEWKRGQLVYCNGLEDEDETISEEENDYKSPHAKAKQTEENIKNQEEYKRRLIAFNPKFKEDFEKFYPICEYSPILSVPSDVKPDWKEAVDECKKMLKESGVFLEE